jgi:hypothetical protein
VSHLPEESSLLDELVSGDASRVMRAAWEVMRTRDGELLDPLIPALPRIRRATARVDLGGMLHPNRATLEHALEKIEHYRDGACWCASYPGLLLISPEKEQQAGHVSIVSTSEPDWSMTYHCRCVTCGQDFDVEQGDYHYTWWKWVPRGIARRRAR